MLALAVAAQLSSLLWPEHSTGIPCTCSRENSQVSACCHWCRHLLCVAAGPVPPKVKVSDVREQLQKQLDEVKPRCLNDD